jgi:hypothetical protein
VALPGAAAWRPPLGFVLWLPRHLYNERDPHQGRPAVVVQHRASTIMVATRTSDHLTMVKGDIWHAATPKLGLDRPGWWQPLHRSYEVPMHSLSDVDVERRDELDGPTFTRVLAAFKGGI